MKYTNCPTCGGLAAYVSNNFEVARILISKEREYQEPKIKHLMQLAESLQHIVEKKIEHLSSEQLYYLYITTLQKEIIAEQITGNRLYGAISREQYEALGKRLYGDNS